MQGANQILGRISLAGQRDPERLCDGGNDVITAGERRELDEPYAVAPSFEQTGGNLKRRARLADSARADERDELVFLNQRRYLGNLRIETYERGRQVRQVVWKRVERAQRREVVREAGRDELVHALGTSKVPQAMLPQIAQTRLRGEIAEHQIGRRARDEDLAAVSDRQQPGDAIHGGAEIVAVPLVGRAGMDRGADAQSAVVQIEPREFALRGQHRRHRVFRSRERRAERITGRLEHVAPMLFDRGAHDFVVATNRPLHRSPVPFPAPRASLDVGEGERYRSTREHASVRSRWHRAHGRLFAPFAFVPSSSSRRKRTL